MLKSVAGFRGLLIELWEETPTRVEVVSGASMIGKLMYIIIIVDVLIVLLFTFCGGRLGGGVGLDLLVGRTMSFLLLDWFLGFDRSVSVYIVWKEGERDDLKYIKLT